MTRDILDHHDRVIHQQTQRDDKAGDGDLIERIAYEIQHRNPESQRQRQRDHDNAGSTQTQWQQGQCHQRHGNRKVDIQAIETLADIARLLEAALQGYVPGQSELVAIQHTVDILLHARVVVTILLIGGDKHGTLAVVATDVA